MKKSAEARLGLRLPAEVKEKIEHRAEEENVSVTDYLLSLVAADDALQCRLEAQAEQERQRRAVRGLDPDPPGQRDRAEENWKGKFTSPAAARLNALRQGRPQPVHSDAEKRASGYPPYISPRRDPLSRRAAFARSFYPPSMRPDPIPRESWPGGEGPPLIGPHVHIPSQD